MRLKLAPSSTYMTCGSSGGGSFCLTRGGAGRALLGRAKRRLHAKSQHKQPLQSIVWRLHKNVRQLSKFTDEKCTMFCLVVLTVHFAEWQPRPRRDRSLSTLSLLLLKHQHNLHVKTTSYYFDSELQTWAKYHTTFTVSYTLVKHDRKYFEVRKSEDKNPELNTSTRLW